MSTFKSVLSARCPDLRSYPSNAAKRRLPNLNREGELGIEDAILCLSMERDLIISGLLNHIPYLTPAMGCRALKNRGTATFPKT